MSSLTLIRHFSAYSNCFCANGVGRNDRGRMDLDFIGRRCNTCKLLCQPPIPLTVCSPVLQSYRMSLKPRTFRPLAQVEDELKMAESLDRKSTRLNSSHGY